MKHKTAWAALLALAALAAHFAVPLAYTDEVVWRHDWSDQEATIDAVPGASMTVTLVGLILLTGGLLTTWLLRRNTLGQFIAASVSLLAAAIVIRSQALWTGRGISSLIQALMRSDGPPPSFTELGTDYYATIWPIAPPIVLALAVLATIWLLRDLIEARQDTATARAHVRPTLWVLTALVLVATLPWAVEEAVDANSTPEAEDMDRFVLSAYDASRLHVDSTVVADELGEAGLSLFDDVAWIPGAAFAAFLLASTASLVGLSGLWRMEEEDKYLGRTLELSGAAVGLLIPVVLAFAVVLVAVFLYGGNDRSDTTPAWAPLVALVPLGLSLPISVANIRRLNAEQDRLVADRFPEPITYD